VRDDALAKKQLPGGRWIYGYYKADAIRAHSYVRVLEDQGWWINYPDPDTNFRDFNDKNLDGWREVYESDGDPMWLREKVLGIFEGADIHVTDVSCPEGESEEIEELYIKDHDRTRVFAEAFKAIYDYSARFRQKVVRNDILVVATVEQPQKV